MHVKSKVQCQAIFIAHPGVISFKSDPLKRFTDHTDVVIIPDVGQWNFMERRVPCKSILFLDPDKLSKLDIEPWSFNYV